MKKGFLKRYSHSFVVEDLKEKMVFLQGPRQVGKTTFALNLLKKPKTSHPAYFNWDDSEDRENIKKGKFPSQEKLIILDEIHKYSQWKNLVKGFYDKRKEQHRFLVTGSGYLGIYRKGGDSLQGRYHSHRMHPFSINEISSDPKKGDFENLLKFGGFPEPLISQHTKTWKRWQRQKVDRLVREDVRDFGNFRDLNLIENLVQTLPRKVGSPLSIKNLREDLGVAHKTVENWVEVLENLYFCFRVAPFTAREARTVKKEKKLYLFDWSEIKDDGVKFENLVASQLLKYCHFTEDTEGHKMELQFLRDTDRREVDFVVLQVKEPLFAVECKSKGQPSKAVHYFKKRTNIPIFYQVHFREEDYQNDFVRVLPFWTFCKELKMP